MSNLNSKTKLVKRLSPVLQENYREYAALPKEALAYCLASIGNIFGTRDLVRAVAAQILCREYKGFLRLMATARRSVEIIKHRYEVTGKISLRDQVKIRNYLRLQKRSDRLLAQLKAAGFPGGTKAQNGDG